MPAQNLPGIVNIAKGQRCAHDPHPFSLILLHFTGIFKSYLKLHYMKGKKSKEGLEVTRGNQPTDLSHKRPPTNPSSLSKVELMSTHYLGASQKVHRPN